MNIGLFFPKVFTLVRDSFNASGVKVNNFYSHQLEFKICFLLLTVFLFIGLILMTVAVRIYSSDSNSVLVSGAFILIMFLAVSYAKVSRDDKAISDVNNGFQLAQTSFQVRPNKIASGKNLYDYLSEKPKTKSSTTNDYQIYAKVYHGKSYQTYLFGTIKNGHFTANIRNTHKTKVATTGMLTALDSYATYIKKHHLESDFKDSAKLELSDNYLDQDYRPMLIMKGKDGQILRVKEQTSATAKNVVLIKSK